jgi:glycerate kinase
MALGAKFLGSDGNTLPLGGGSLRHLHAIDLSALDKRLLTTKIEILSDVRSPLLGIDGAAAVFAPQKGANAQEVNILEQGLAKLAHSIEELHLTNYSEVAGSGAAGGTAFGLMTFSGAKIFPGFFEIAKLISLESKVRNCDLVITAEGKLDLQSFNGKATGELASVCKQLQKPLYVFPALIDENLLFKEQLGIESVYATAVGKYSSYEDIVRSVHINMKKEHLIANIFNSGSSH